MFIPLKNSRDAGGTDVATLPALEESRPLLRWLFRSAIAVAYLLLAVLAVRLAPAFLAAPGWMLVALVAGIVAADFVSGLVHWGADTWGRDDLPVIGPALLVPFRVHHVNPDDLCLRRFVDVNGDVALLAVPALGALQAVPVDTAMGGAAAAFGAAFCAASMLTNQVHQWAHMPAPPRLVRVLQACGLVLDAPAHARHHERPYDVRYCITTGWCNAPLERLRFFRRLEALVTAVTRAQPRRDDQRYEQRYSGQAVQ